MRYAQVYDRLTPKQEELLAQIADVAKESRGEPTFRVESTKTAPTRFYVSDTSDEKSSTEWPGAKVALAVLDELGLVHMHSDSLFVLRQAALTYPRWRNRPRWLRWLSVKWDSWESDVRGGLITIVASVAASLVITVLTNLLLR